MRRLILATALVGSGLLFGLAGANAQGVDKPDKPDGPALSERFPQGPRVYGYYRQDGQWVARKPQDRGGCGTYHFWNGEYCVDARDGR
jgi:hypothetical protein